MLEIAQLGRCAGLGREWWPRGRFQAEDGGRECSVCFHYPNSSSWLLWRRSSLGRARFGVCGVGTVQTDVMTMRSADGAKRRIMEAGSVDSGSHSFSSDGITRFMAGTSPCFLADT